MTMQHWYVDSGGGMPPGTLWGHVVAISTWLGSLLGILPALAALFAVLFYALQMYESDTCQKWLESKRKLKKAKRLAKLKAEQKMLVAEIDALEVVREARAVAAEKVAVAAHEAAKQAASDAAAIHEQSKNV
jgi:hypothetical protein